MCYMLICCCLVGSISSMVLRGNGVSSSMFLCHNMMVTCCLVTIRSEGCIFTLAKVAGYTGGKGTSRFMFDI